MKPYTLDESRTIINISTACRTEKGKWWDLDQNKMCLSV